MESRILLAYMVGFLLAIGPFDHVVVSALHVLFGVWHSDAMGYADVWRNVGLSTIGTLAGGLLLITLTHTGQSRTADLAPANGLVPSASVGSGRGASTGHSGLDNSASPRGVLEPRIGILGPPDAGFWRLSRAASGFRLRRDRSVVLRAEAFRPLDTSGGPQCPPAHALSSAAS